MQKISHIKYIITIAICSLQMAIFDIYAQQTIDLGIRTSYSFALSPRWTLSADGSLYRQTHNFSGIWGRLSIKGQFKAMERRLLFASASVSHEEYSNIDNSDTEIRLVEGVQFLTQTNFSHSFYLSQRKVFYKPSADEAFCSDITWYQQYSFRNLFTHCTPYIVMSETANITPDISNAPILQRFRFGGGVSIKASDKMNIAINYTHAIGSERQIFIGDADGLNMLTLVIGFSKLL